MVIIKYDSLWRERRDLATLFVTLFAAIELPLRVTFNAPFGPFVLGSEIVITVVYLLDVALKSFAMEEKIGARWLRTPREIGQSYLRRWFFPDLITAMPFYLLAAALLEPETPGLVYLGLNRLLRIPHALRTMAAWRFRKIVNPGVFRLLLFLFWLLVFSHLTACGWILMGGIETGGAPIDTYVTSLYWTLTTLTTVGYGDITPTDTAQRLYTMVVMLIGVGSWGYVVGNIASLFSSMDLVRSRHMRTLEEMNALLRYRAVPEEIQGRVNEYFRHLWDHQLTLEESRLLRLLPPELAADVALCMHRDLLRKVPLFRNADAEFIRDIVQKLVPMVVMPGAYFIRRGEVGDHMYFIGEGVVEVVADDGDDVFATLGPGDFVGETALVRDIPRTASVRARGYCDLYVLSRQDFDECLRAHPVFARHIRDVAAERERERRIRGSA